MDVADMRERVRRLMPGARRDLGELVAFRSVADPRLFPAEECVAAARWVRDAFAAVGVDNTALIETSDGSLAVLGHTPAPAGAPTVLLYSHYDVQPRATNRSGTLRRSRSPNATAAGTGAAPRTARAIS